MTDKMTSEQAKDFLASVMKECEQEYAGSFRELCVGIEAGLQDLMMKKIFVSRLKFDFHSKGVILSELECVHEKPENYTIVGMWTVIYACVTPRYTPFGPDPLRVTSLEVGYDMDPKVTYDASFDNGLPLALNRAYEPEKIAKKQKEFQEELMKMPQPSR